MKLFKSTFFAVAIATASLMFVSAAMAQDGGYMPSAGQVPFQGPMGPGSAGGGQQFMPTTMPGGYATQGVQGMGEVPAYVQTTGSAGCGLNRNANTRLINQGGTPVLAPSGGH